MEHTGTFRMENSGPFSNGRTLSLLQMGEHWFFFERENTGSFFRMENSGSFSNARTLALLQMERTGTSRVHNTAAARRHLTTQWQAFDHAVVPALCCCIGCAGLRACARKQVRGAAPEGWSNSERLCRASPSGGLSSVDHAPFKLLVKQRAAV